MLVALRVGIRSSEFCLSVSPTISIANLIRKIEAREGSVSSLIGQGKQLTRESLREHPLCEVLGIPTKKEIKVLSNLDI